MFDVLKFSDPGGLDRSWYYDDAGLIKHSWFKKNNNTYNIYTWNFEKGSHGMPMRNYIPVVSQPIPEMFDEKVGLLWPRLQKQFDQVGHEYFDENVHDRFLQRYKQIYG